MFNVQVLGCWGAYPEPGEATSGYLITTDEAKILVDCGSGVLSQLFRVCPVEELTAVVMSHNHHDHAADLGPLGYAALLTGLAGKLANAIPVFHPRWPDALLDYWSQRPLLDFLTVSDGDEISLPGLKVRFRKTEHPVECMSMRFTHADGVFTYSADSSWSEALIEQASEADLFLCEASMYGHQADVAKNAGHLTSTECGELARRAGAKRLAITHFPHYGSLDDLRSEVEESFGDSVTRVAVGTVLQL